MVQRTTDCQILDTELGSHITGSGTGLGSLMVAYPSQSRRKGPMSCKRCGGNHRGWEKCLVVTAVVTPMVVTGSYPGGEVVTPAPLVVTGNRHGKYRDEEKRKWYLRLYMQTERAFKAGRAERVPSD